MEEVVGAEESVVRGGELGGKHGTEGKAAAAVGGAPVVFDPKTAHGALARYISDESVTNFQPMKFQHT